MSTTTKPDYLTVSAYEEATDLPRAIELNRGFIRHERRWAARYPDTANDLAPNAEGQLTTYSEHLNHFSEALLAAEGIWHEEMIAIRQRIADRIAAEVPGAENYQIPQAVASGDYSLMAC